MTTHYMRQDYYDAVYYGSEDSDIGSRDVYCVGCLPPLTQQTITDDPRAEHANIMPIFASDEADYYPTCVACGTQHTYTALTDDGRLYERAQTIKRLRAIVRARRANVQSAKIATDQPTD